MSYNQKLWMAKLSWAAYPSFESKHHAGEGLGKGDANPMLTVVENQAPEESACSCWSFATEKPGHER
jgi:hypothetical protein